MTDATYNGIHSLENEKLEVIDPYEEGTMSTSSSSQRYSKKRDTGYGSPNSQNSERRYIHSQSRGYISSPTTSLNCSIQNNKDQ